MSEQKVEVVVEQSKDEIIRILKPGRQAYLSLGWPPPLGFVDKMEWEKILEKFTILQRGGFFPRVGFSFHKT